MLIIGLMSGTSADGVDAAVVEIQSPPFAWRLLKHITVPHPPQLRDEILACANTHTGTVDRICALNFDVAEAFANAAIAAAHAVKIPLEAIDLIGSHGQTVWHMPGHSTLQIGSAAVIAERTGASVISNFRARDVAAGGQGAPLVAYVDALLLTHPTKTRAAQNIGGIGNITYLPTSTNNQQLITPFAFDTGPGNMLMDDAVRRMTEGAMQCDVDGVIAARGRVHGELLEELMAHPFLQARPPKTTGREMFGAQFGEQVWQRGLALGMRPEDIVCTLTMFTALSIKQAYQDFLPQMPDEVIVSGGGARNPTLMRLLRDELRPAQVMMSDEVGIPTEAKEALAFAILAYETAHGRHSNLPAATGATRAVVLGDITPGPRWRFV